MSNSLYTYDKVVKVKRKHENRLLVKQNVVGCAAGFKKIDGKETSELSIVVYVTLKCGELDEKNKIPKSLERLFER